VLGEQRGDGLWVEQTLLRHECGIGNSAKLLGERPLEPGRDGYSKPVFWAIQYGRRERIP
jgi:hypothetical protein